jgi:hypothetical protein
MVKMVLSISNDVKGFVLASPQIDLRVWFGAFDIHGWRNRAAEDW